MNWPILTSDLGDVARITPVAMVIAYWTWNGVNRLTAVMFGLGYVVTALLVFGLKLMSSEAFGAPAEVGLFRFSSGAPSGHVALSVFVYGSAVLLCRQAKADWSVPTARVACAAVILSVAFTRVSLGAHSLADVAAGGVIGALTLGGTFFFAPTTRKKHASTAWLMAAVLTVNLLMILTGVRAKEDFGLL